MQSSFLFMALLMSFALALLPALQRLKVPVPVVFIATGFIGSELITFMGFDLGIRWHSLGFVFLNILIPIVLFDAVLKLKPQDLGRQVIPILALSIPFTLISCLAIASCLYWLIGHENGFPWHSALIAGALLSITNPIATISTFSCAPNALKHVISGESLFNSIVAISLFSFLIDNPMQDVPLHHSAFILLERLGVASILGLLIGGLCAVLINKTDHQHQQTLLSYLACFSSLALTNIISEGGGITAAFICALSLSYWSERQARPLSTLELPKHWGLLSYTAAISIFLLMGISITPQMFTERYLAMLSGIVIVFGSRYLLMQVMGAFWLPRATRHFLGTGGLRGGAIIALALSLPIELEGWWTIQAIAYGVVLASIIIQLPLLNHSLRRHYTDPEAPD